MKQEEISNGDLSFGGMFLILLSFVGIISCSGDTRIIGKIGLVLSIIGIIIGIVAAIAGVICELLGVD